MAICSTNNAVQMEMQGSERSLMDVADSINSRVKTALRLVESIRKDIYGSTSSAVTGHTQQKDVDRTPLCESLYNTESATQELEIELVRLGSSIGGKQ